MYTNLYVYIALPSNMAGKLYWRIKKNGKWTWKSACMNYVHVDGHVVDCQCDIQDSFVEL